MVAAEREREIKTKQIVCLETKEKNMKGLVETGSSRLLLVKSYQKRIMVPVHIK
jgi:hypothetical protein